MFIYPHKLILKTCGTTTLLLGLEKILSISKSLCNLNSIFQVFYSRKTFMFPERQRGPHKDWLDEVKFLDKFFENGNAYNVGKVNGDHWLLYMSSNEQQLPIRNHSFTTPPDITLELLMTNLDLDSCKLFYYPQISKDDEISCHKAGKSISDELGISSLFKNISLDAFLFQPCGYSSNAIWLDENDHDKYFTIHVTPEHEISYASFETNANFNNSQELNELIKKVIEIFKPGKLTSTLFVSLDDHQQQNNKIKPPNEFNSNLFDNYNRVDRINYEFPGYER